MTIVITDHYGERFIPLKDNTEVIINDHILEYREADSITKRMSGQTLNLLDGDIEEARILNNQGNTICHMIIGSKGIIRLK